MPRWMGALAAAALTACRSGTNAPGLAPEAYCGAIARAYAEQQGRCWAATPACVAATGAQPDPICAAFVAFVEAGRIRYDAVAAAACVARVSAESCAQFDWGGVREADPCLRVFSGTVLPGGACASYLECLDGFCDFAAPCQGTCVAHRAAGESCSSPSDCEPQLECVGQTCVVPSYGAEGQPCTGAYTGCGPGLWCDAGTCRAQVAAGGSCATDTRACAVGTWCGTTQDPGCTACIPSVGPGAPCGTCTGICASGAFCDVTGRCAAQPALGEPCTAASGCLLPSWCDPATSRCTPPLGEDAPCAAPDACDVGLYCDPGTQLCRALIVCVP